MKLGHFAILVGLSTVAGCLAGELDPIQKNAVFSFVVICSFLYCIILVYGVYELTNALV